MSAKSEENQASTGVLDSPSAAEPRYIGRYKPPYGEKVAGRHLKSVSGVWHYFRRVPKQFADVDSRRFVEKSCETRDDRLAAQKAARFAQADDQRWHDLALAALAEKEAEREAGAVAAERVYQRAVRLARLHGFAYRTAEQIAAEASPSELRRRIDKVSGAGLMDTETTTALLGLVEPPAATFRACAEAYVKTHGATWKNKKHRQQWENTLRDYVYPTCGDLDVGQVDVAHIVSCLEPIWLNKKETASRVRMRIEAVLDWAAASNYRSGLNPARWKGHLENLLAKRKKRVKHHEALPYGELAAFMAALRDKPGTGARAVEFTILTAVRSGEARGATWQEIDFKNAVWSIPAERMKWPVDHRVPLAPAAMAVLSRVGKPDPRDFIFPGERSGKPLSDMTLLKVLEDMGYRGEGTANITVHGFRSTFSDWTSETTNHSPEVREMALAHVIENKVEAAYRRGELFAKRRELMQDWARFCDGPSPTTREVGQ
jgi:integrase